MAPKGELLNAPSRPGVKLPTDAGASYDRTIELRAEDIAPQVTWGTSPGMVTGVDGRFPIPGEITDKAVRKATGRCAGIYGVDTRYADYPDQTRQGLHRVLHERPH